MSEQREKFPWETIYIREISTPKTRPVMLDRAKTVLLPLLIISLLILVGIKLQVAIELLSTINSCT